MDYEGISSPVQKKLQKRLDKGYRIKRKTPINE